MAINVSDLPPKYQAQAMKKYMEQQCFQSIIYFKKYYCNSFI